MSAEVNGKLAKRAYAAKVVNLPRNREHSLMILFCAIEKGVEKAGVEKEGHQRTLRPLRVSTSLFSIVSSRSDVFPGPPA